MTYKVEILPTTWEDLKGIEDWYLIQFGVETALKVCEHNMFTMLHIHRQRTRNYFISVERIKPRKCGIYAG